MKKSSFDNVYPYEMSPDCDFLRLVTHGVGCFIVFTPFDETFTHVVMWVTICTLIALAMQKRWRVKHLDVKIVFFNWMLKEKMYMYQLEGFVVGGNEQKVCKLQCALYGLKQAPCTWYSRINNYFLSQGLNKSKEDSNMYYFIRNGKYVIILLYFDDLFVIGDDWD